MNNIALLLILMLTFSRSSIAQSLDQIFTNIDTLCLKGGVPSHISPINQEVIPIISNNPYTKPLEHFALATPYKNAKVLAIGHEALLTNDNIVEYDNLRFLSNAIDWLAPSTDRKKVVLKEGWVSEGNTSILQEKLKANNYSFSILKGQISTASLTNTDILILGNDWNENQPYTASELAALESFVSNGGSIFIAGLGWSWPKDLEIYPMYQAAKLFGIEYTRQSISDPYSKDSGAHKFYNFFPKNQDQSLSMNRPSPFFGTNIKRGDMLRVFRLAVSSTGEFTEQNMGLASTNILLGQWLAEINDTYGREYCVRFELIPNNDLLIFEDPKTDPWPTIPFGSSGCTNADLILSKQGPVIDKIIGSDNYDISHVITGNSFSGGCASNPKGGVSGGFNVGVARHEMGHQFSQSHTINHSDNNNYEPENGGWTIQGGNRQPYAHAQSYHELAQFLRSQIPDMGAKVPTGNTIPTVNAGPDVYIPISTPFLLTGIATDPDTEDQLTYVWDNMNAGNPQKIPVADDSQGALFMRLLPTENPSRTFPKMEDVLANNNSNEQEQLPTQARQMHFRLTVNDNHQMSYKGKTINASAINSDDILVTVAAAGPFRVTSQNNSGIIYPARSVQTVTWDVNGTDKMPINTQEVSIHLSTDGGLTFPFLLSNNAANTGSARVTLPHLSTQSARIRVSANNSVYFDVNGVEFGLGGGY